MKIRTDFVTNSSSQSYIAVTIYNPELARLCREYKIKLDVRGDVVSYNYNDLEGAADFIKPEAKDFVNWFLHFIDFERVADKKACEKIEENRKNIEDAFVKSVIVVSHIDEAEGCYWEEKRNKKEIELKGFDDQSWNNVWNNVSHDEIADLYDGDDIEYISPSNYPLRQLISDNWGFQWGLHSRDDKDQIFIKRMIKQYGTKRIKTDVDLSLAEDKNSTDLESRLFEYSGELEGAVSIGLEEAEKVWKGKIAKKAKKVEVSNYSGDGSIVTVPAFIDGFPVKKVGVLTQNPEKIEEVIIPHTVESLASKTFKGCINLSKLVISENTEVPLGAFGKCDKLGDKK